jgi:hypothetical protein
MIRLRKGPDGSVGVYICAGPNNLFLYLTFAPGDAPARVTTRLHPRYATADPERVRVAVLRGVARANAECASDLHPSEIRYQIEWPWDGMFTHGAYLIARQYAQLGEAGFETLPNA